MSTAIKVENLSKIYRLGEIGTGTISRDLERWVAKIRGKEDPFLKIGQTNDRTQKGNSDIVYSLQDINFEIEQGDAVGIIGRNGAGKSTLLKILSRVTSPSTGKINIKGRVASLLEVGTGFHPELTGRENIFLNGAILGMRKKEIQRKLDEIIDFSGVERYVDTPVKRYSSGMYVRLAFAVAAHLESEILIVDEVLAVGDAEFQKKCLGKMGDVSKGEGRTVLFVSHNMSALHQLCNKSILFENGRKVYEGNTGETIAEYIKRGVQQSASSDITSINDPLIKWLNIEFIQNEYQTKQLLNNTPFQLKIDYEIKEDIDGFRLFVGIEDDLSQVICKSFFDEENKNGTVIKKGQYSSILKIPANLLLEGSYIFKIHAGVHNQRVLNPKDGIILAVDLLETGKLYRKQYPKSFAGNVTLPIEWHTKSI
jgi:lipopolysaccharide transport system ATP-binding protein